MYCADFVFSWCTLVWNSVFSGKIDYRSCMLLCCWFPYLFESWMLHLVMLAMYYLRYETWNLEDYYNKILCGSCRPGSALCVSCWLTYFNVPVISWPIFGRSNILSHDHVREYWYNSKVCMLLVSTVPRVSWRHRLGLYWKSWGTQHMCCAHIDSVYDLIQHAECREQI